MISCTSELKTAVSSDLVGLSGCLLAKGLISEHNHSELRNRNIEEADRAARMVELIQRKVKLDRHNYFTFTGILEGDSRFYGEILHALKRKYHLQGND